MRQYINVSAVVIFGNDLGIIVTAGRGTTTGVIGGDGGNDGAASFFGSMVSGCDGSVGVVVFRSRSSTTFWLMSVHTWHPTQVTTGSWCQAPHSRSDVGATRAMQQ